METSITTVSGVSMESGVSGESPYYPLSEYLKARFGGRVWKVTLDAGLGCPNWRPNRGPANASGKGGCVYCECETLLPKDHPGAAPITAQLSASIERVRKRHKAERFIAYFQTGTNTFADVKTLRTLYNAAASHPEVAALAVSTRPDCVGDDVLDLLCDLKRDKPLWLELGLQSANDKTLELIGRGHSATCFTDAVRRAHERNIDVCAHVIFGLPGEGRVDMLSTVRLLASLGVWGVKFHQLQVLKGTPLEAMYNEGRDGRLEGRDDRLEGRDDRLRTLTPGSVVPLSMEDYASLVADSLELLPPDTVIHRLSGEVPERYLVAPRWGLNKFIVKERVCALLKERQTHQGCLYEGSPGEGGPGHPADHSAGECRRVPESAGE